MRHSEIIVQSFDPQKKTFHLLFYGMHEPKVVFQTDVDEKIVYDTIMKSILARKWGNKKLLEVRTLKKILITTKIKRTKKRVFRLTEKEDLMLTAKAKRKELDISDYIRLKLFS